MVPLSFTTQNSGGGGGGGGGGGATSPGGMEERCKLPHAPIASLSTVENIILGLIIFLYVPSLIELLSQTVKAEDKKISQLYTIYT